MFFVEMVIGLRGFHVYSQTWTPILDENIGLIREPDNPFDRFAIKGTCKDRDVGHLPREVSKILFSVMDQCDVQAQVFGKPRGAKGGKGIEVPIKVTIGSDVRKTITKLERQLRKKKCVEKLTIKPKRRIRI